MSEQSQQQTAAPTEGTAPSVPVSAPSTESQQQTQQKQPVETVSMPEKPPPYSQEDPGKQQQQKQQQQQQQTNLIQAQQERPAISSTPPIPGAAQIPHSQSPGMSKMQSKLGGGRLQQLIQKKVQPSLRMGMQGKQQSAVRLKQIKMNRINVATPRPSGGSNQPLLPTPRSALHYIEESLGPNATDEDKERIRRETIDPFMRNKPATRVDRKVWVVFPFVMGATFVLLLLCFGIDNLTKSWTLNGVLPAHYDYSFTAFIYTIWNPNPDQSRAVMESVTNTLAFVFGLLVTIIGIILQFASEKITSHVTSLFFSDKIILGSLTFVLVSNAFALWVYLECGTFHSPRFAVVLSVFTVNIQLVMLFPFLAYLFFFLDPEEVVTNIMTNGLNAVISSINLKGTNNDKNQVSATLSIEYLMDGALSSLKKKNKNITSEILDAFCSFVMHYSSMKEKAPKIWFEVPLWIRQSPDFLILNDEGIKELVDRELWVEWKILRQYQNLFVEAIKFFKEMCYHISINTRIIAETAANFGQLRTIDLCVKFFNTYIRTALNLNDVRVVYNVVFQYRQLAEILLDRDKNASRELAVRALKIAKFMRYYAFLCHQKDLFFLVETVAQDLRVLCEVAVRNSIATRGKGTKVGWDPSRAIYSEVHEKLLNIFLSLGDFTGASGAKRGVIRAQVILATFYITEDQLPHARKIHKQLDNDANKELLLSVREELTMATTKEFWEVSERGSNFAYLEPRLRSFLYRFFGWFPWGAAGQQSDASWTAFQNSKEGKQLHVQQELQNFETELAEDEDDDYDEDVQGGEADDESVGTGDLDLSPTSAVVASSTSTLKVPVQTTTS